MRRALVLLLAVSLPSCAHFREPVPPRFERVALETQVARDDRGRVAGDLDAYSSMHPVFAYIAAGMVGAGAGVALGSCLGTAGSADATVCYGSLAATGAVAVAALGVYAVIVGTGGLPRVAASHVTARLGALEQDRSLDDELARAVREAVPEPMQAAAGDAQAVAQARLDEIDLRQHPSGQLSLRLRASLVQTWERPGEAPNRSTCRYSYTTERRHVNEWLAERDAFETSVAQGLDSIAGWIARDLADPASCSRG